MIKHLLEFQGNEKKLIDLQTINFENLIKLPRMAKYFLNSTGTHNKNGKYLLIIGKGISIRNLINT